MLSNWRDPDFCPKSYSTLIDFRNFNITFSHQICHGIELKDIVVETETDCELFAD